MNVIKKTVSTCARQAVEVEITTVTIERAKRKSSYSARGWCLPKVNAAVPPTPSGELNTGQNILVFLKKLDIDE